MTTPNNLGTIDINNNTTNVGTYFNNFFNNYGTVSPDQNAALISYFEQYTGGNRFAAQALAGAVVYTALAQGMNPMSVLQQFASLPQGQLDSYLAMFLNLNRIGTSFLGINNQPITNKYVKRSILA